MPNGRYMLTTHDGDVWLTVPDNANATLAIGGLRVCGAGSPRDPDAIRGLHRRIERGYETAGRTPHLDPHLAAPMFVRLAIGEKNQRAAGEAARNVRHSRVRGQKTCPHPVARAGGRHRTR